MRFCLPPPSGPAWPPLGQINRSEFLELLVHGADSHVMLFKMAGVPTLIDKVSRRRALSRGVSGAAHRPPPVGREKAKPRIENHGAHRPLTTGGLSERGGDAAPTRACSRGRPQTRDLAPPVGGCRYPSSPVRPSRAAPRPLHPATMLPGRRPGCKRVLGRALPARAAGRLPH